MTVQVSIADWLKFLYEAHGWILEPNPYNTRKLAIWMMRSPTGPPAIGIARSPKTRATGRLRPYAGRSIRQIPSKRLQRQLQKTIAGGLPVTDIYFPGGGRLPIPDWFRDWCTKMGIRIHIVDPHELPNAIPDHG